MPLGQRAGDKGDSRYCGVETDFTDDMPHALTHNLSSGFDFVVAPLVDPSYRPSLPTNDDSPVFALHVSASDLIVSPAQWSNHVVGKISSWIDLESDDEKLRMDSETALKQEISWASHLSVQACLLPPPKKGCYSNYARCVNQIVQGITNMQLWLRLPLEILDSAEKESADARYDPLSERLNDSWELWNSFRLLCEHHSQLSVALDIRGSLPPVNSLLRWFGEPVKAAIFHTNAFLTNARGYPCLSKRHQKLITAFFDLSFQIVISGPSMHDITHERLDAPAGDIDSLEEGEPVRHELKPYLEYVAYLYQRMDPLSEQERFEINYRDFLQAPLQPLMDNLEAQTYETFEKDIVKYSQYQRAICKALTEKTSEEQASSSTTVLMVVGAGRGPLVRASLQAAEEAGRKIKVYAVEKNPNAVVTLHSLIKLEGWASVVTVISCDMRSWAAPEKADILVSELLGSFGDNELSPECLDGAMRFLKPDGISIPSSYTSYLQPITSTKLYNDVKSHKDLAHMETAYVVKLHKIARLAPAQPVFTFLHPGNSPDKSNERYVKLRFEIPRDTGSTLVHGFAGYFDAALYGNIHLSIEPSSPTPTMFSWWRSSSMLSCKVEWSGTIRICCSGIGKIWVLLAQKKENYPTPQNNLSEGSGEIYNGSMYSPDRGTYSDSDLFNDWPKNSMVNSVRSLSVGKAVSKVNPEAPEGDLKNLIKNKNQEIGGYICTWEPPIGLKLGKRTYFEKKYSTSMSIIPSGASVKRSRETQQASQRSYCQVEGCNIDLMAAKEYYRKHRVCVNHSRSPRVIVAGHERRFCQQCSRGLSDHNAQPESSRLCPDAYDDTRHKDFYLNLAPLSQIKHLSSTSPLWDQSQCFSSSNNVLQDEFNWLKPFKIATTEVFNQGREACVAASNLNGAPDLQRALSLLSADTWCPSSAAQSKTIQVARSNPTSLLHSPSQAVWQDYHWLAFNLYSSGGSHVEELQLSKVPFETALFEAT